MQWWNDFVTWLSSSTGVRVLTTSVLPFVAIIIAGLLAAWIANGTTRRVLRHQNGELKSAAIMALIGAGRKAAIWSSLGADEKQHIDSLISEADLRIRLLPVNGSSGAADWAAHEISAMKKNSATFSFQAEQTFFDYRDRLLEWQSKPKRARKLFAYDLEQWRYEDNSAPAPVSSAPDKLPVVPTVPSIPSTPSVPSAPTAAASPAVAAPTVAAASTTAFAMPAASSPNGSEPVPTRQMDLPTAPPGLTPQEDQVIEPVGEPTAAYPPMTAGDVRERVSPDTTLDEDR